MGRMQGKIEKGLRLGVAFLAALACGALFVHTAPSLLAQESAPETIDFVSKVLPYPLDTVHERILAEYDSETRSYFEDYNRAIYDLPEKVLSYKDLSKPAYDRFMAMPLVKPTKFYVFYGAYSVMQRRLQNITPVSVIGLTNPALVRYASLPMAQRSDDIYVWSPDTPYWYSEYALHDMKLPFRSYFIFHLSAVDATHTNVEVIEHKPVVRIAGKPSIDETGKLQNFELKEVAPTTRERQFLLSCVQQFIERDVPSRAKFNCKDGTEPEPIKWSN